MRFKQLTIAMHYSASQSLLESRVRGNPGSHVVSCYASWLSVGACVNTGIAYCNNGRCFIDHWVGVFWSEIYAAYNETQFLIALSRPPVEI